MAADRKARYGALFLGGVLILGALYYTNDTYYRGLLEAEGTEDVSGKPLDYQFHLIVSDPSSAFWQEVYESGKTYSEEHQILLELSGNGEDSGYTKIDYMNMSIAAQVDGILVENNGEEGLAEKIDEAVEKGIPVVTVLGDASYSQKISFVGVSDYQLGSAYGTQIAANAGSDTKEICILMKRVLDEKSQSQLYSQIYSAATEAAGTSEDINVTLENLMSDGPFDTEEAVREILQRGDTPPELLICMDEETTECVRQALIDFNMTGEVQVIGYYTSENILDAVSKGIIASTCSLDTNQLGSYSVEALLEYIKEGRVNSYYNVDINFVNQEQASAMLRRINNEKISAS